jgi:hypothetical protein
MRISSSDAVLRVVAAIAAFALLTPDLGAQGVNITLKAWREPVLMDTLRQDHALKAAPEKVYEAALRAFADLGIPTGRTDGTKGIIGSERFERMTSLAGSPMSRAFECGRSPAGPYADSFRLEIAVVAWVAPLAGGTNLGLATIASGRDISGVGRNPKECASTGALELKLLDRITKIVGG